MSLQTESFLLRASRELASHAIIGVHPEGTITHWNRGAVRLTGIEETEALGAPLGKLLPAQGLVLDLPFLESLAGREEEEEIWLLSRSGPPVWARIAVARAPDEGAQRGGLLLVLRDATALHDARAELHRAHTMFEGILAIASDAVVCIDEQHRIIFFNQGAERIFGYTPEEVLGERLELLIPESYRADHGRQIDLFGGSAIASRQMGERGAISARRRSGEIFPAEASISQLRIGEDRIFTAVLRDVSERHQVEQALARQTRELMRSNAELEQFAYVASHDLQEPLRMVASYTQLLARRYRGQLDEDADEFIGYAVDGVTRMQALINDLLAFSRIGRRRSELAPLEVQEVLDSALFSLSAAIEEKGAHISAGPLPIIRGDSRQLHQLFQNLIQNAIKFQHPGIAPQIEIAAEEEAERWRFRVRDNGIGIAPEFHERIFTIFQRLHGRDEYEGTGIGLAICRKIVERHGGTMTLESAPGAGTTFYFTLAKEMESA